MNRIRLENTDFEGKNNIYVLNESPPNVLIDTGMATDEMRVQFRDGLAGFGLDTADIDAVFLTHWHPDHVGLAGDVAESADADIYIHEADAPLVENRAWRQMAARWEELFEEWGMPRAKRDEVMGRFDREDDELSGALLDVEPFGDGDTFDVGEYELEVLHAPGHTAGLSCFAFDGDRGREVFSGDALLPVYTPNVGGADVRVDHALQRYLDTLVRLIDADFARAWPGHRDEIDDPTGRAIDIIDHHRDRTERILDILREHDALDAWSVGAHLFGELVDIHILHGPGEAYAHLDHLEHAGIVDRTPDGYVLVDEDPDLAALFPDTAAIA